MADDATWLLSGAGLTALSGVVWGIWDRVTGKRNRQEDSQKNEREHMLTYLDERGKAALARLDADLVQERARSASIQEAKDALQARYDKLERLLDTWQDIAREWKDRCRELKHAMASVRSVVNLYRHKDGKEEFLWPDETLPPVEDIAADNARRVKERADRLLKGILSAPEPDEI